jgi:hypothetical protein
VIAATALGCGLATGAQVSVGDFQVFAGTP